MKSEGSEKRIRICHYLFFFEVGGDYAARRAEFRDARFEKLWKRRTRSEPRASLPLNGSVLLFKDYAPDFRSLTYLERRPNPRIRKCL